MFTLILWLLKYVIYWTSFHCMDNILQQWTPPVAAYGSCTKLVELTTGMTTVPVCMARERRQNVM